MDFLVWFDNELMSLIQSMYNIGGDITDKFFALFSVLGEENFLIIFLFSVYWSIDKKLGEFIIFSLGTSLSINNEFKNIIARNRPFMSEVAINHRYVIVDGPFVSTKDLGNSFSFPSGHAQISATYLTSIGLWFKNKAVCVTCVILMIGVMISRIYLGVHYPTDVIFGAVLGSTISYILWKLFNIFYSKRYFLYLGLLCVVLTGVIISQDSDSYKVAGLTIGMLIGVLYEAKYIKFTVEGTVIRRIVRSVLGIIILLMLRFILKMFFGENIYLDALRYFIIGITAMSIWPWIFSRLKNI